MARSRRRSTWNKKRRPKTDWVVNADCYRRYNNEIVLTSGSNVGIPLTYCSAARNVLIGYQSQTEDTWNAFPEADKNQTVYAVRGDVVVSARGEWSGNANIFVCMRICACLQDPADGAAVVEPNYSIYFPSVVEPSYFANERFIYQRAFIWEAEVFDKQTHIIPINVKTRLSLQPDHALYLLVESSGISADCSVIPHLRTLMRAS